MEYSLFRLRGASGKTYDFEIRPYPCVFDSFGAVYIVGIIKITGEEVEEHGIIKAGATEDMAREFSPHPKAALFNKHGANSVCVLRVDHPGARLVIYQDLSWMYTLKPPPL